MPPHVRHDTQTGPIGHARCSRQLYLLSFIFPYLPSTSHSLTWTHVLPLLLVALYLTCGLISCCLPFHTRLVTGLYSVCPTHVHAYLHCAWCHAVTCTCKVFIPIAISLLCMYSWIYNAHIHAHIYSPTPISCVSTRLSTRPLGVSWPASGRGAAGLTPLWVFFFSNFTCS